MSNLTTRTAGFKAALREPKRRLHRKVEMPDPEGNRRQRRAYAALQRLEQELQRERLAAYLRETLDWSE